MKFVDMQLTYTDNWYLEMLVNLFIFSNARDFHVLEERKLERCFHYLAKYVGDSLLAKVG